MEGANSSVWSSTVRKRAMDRRSPSVCSPMLRRMLFVTLTNSLRQISSAGQPFFDLKLRAVRSARRSEFRNELHRLQCSLENAWRELLQRSSRGLRTQDFAEIEDTIPKISSRVGQGLKKKHELQIRILFVIFS